MAQSTPQAKPSDVSEVATVAANPQAAFIGAVIEKGGIGAVMGVAIWLMLQDAVARLEFQISGHDGHGGLAGQIEGIDDRIDTIENSVNQVKIDVVRLQMQVGDDPSPPPRPPR